MDRLRLSTSPRPVASSWYAIPLRLIVGIGFIQHGYAKLARGPEDFIARTSGRLATLPIDRHHGSQGAASNPSEPKADLERGDSLG